MRAPLRAMGRRAVLAAGLAAIIAGCTGPAPAVPPAPSVPAAPAAAAPGLVPTGTIVDLSHAYDANSIFWPTADPFRLERVADGVTAGGFYYAANNFFAAEHGGTHIDAPVHFAQGRESVDQIPLEHLVGPAVVVDVTAAASANPDYQIGVADLEAWEKTNGAIDEGVILLLRTGFSTRWPDAARYLGTSERGPAAVPKLHFPGLHPDAARWLVANRRVHALGIDTASIDYGQSTTFESHRVLYEVNIPAFENLTSLERLPARGAFVVALPMKITGGSGAPLRAIAILPARPGG